MNFKRLLNTPLGRFFVSVILGLGIATLFRKVCKDKDCLVFNGPILSEFDEKIYQYGEKCYTYTTTPMKCDPSKKMVDIQSAPTEEEKMKKNEETQNILLKGATPSASSPGIFSSFFPK
jgi:hypothetical protein